MCGGRVSLSLLKEGKTIMNSVPTVCLSYSCTHSDLRIIKHCVGTICPAWPMFRASVPSAIFGTRTALPLRTMTARGEQHRPVSEPRTCYLPAHYFHLTDEETEA